jgi:sugar lactone lactonase YvrE
MTWGTDGCLYVTDSAAKKVLKCDPAADTVTYWSPPTTTYPEPEQLETLSDGRIVVGGTGVQNKLYLVDAAGNPTLLVSANQADTPAYNPDDDYIYFTFALRVLDRIHPDGSGWVDLTGNIFTQAEGMAVAPNGDLWVADYGAGSLMRVAYGTWATTTVLAGLGVNQAVAVDPGGLVYVGDATNDRILRYDPVTTLSEVYATGTPGPRAMDFGPDGRLYIADAEAHMVLVCGDEWLIGMVG